ncbi:MAG TPA: hypothetical protein DEQ38_09705 [Elusimicrobia bacterium]|nr:MAG: hypothetical protein A2089_04130 [Elusimicrobia bacterium GWD2_63_28]HCC48371.1 hypothetical protein [Elusimicrobiota bacterium]
MSIAAALLTFFVSAAHAGAGGDALPFLKMDAGARGAALSGAYAAAGDDALSVFYNPAGTALAGKKEILVGHNEWLEGIRNEILAYVHPLGPRLTLFAGVNMVLSGSMDRYDNAGVRDGSFSALEGAISAGLSGKLGPGFYGGAALKSLSQQAAGGSAAAWAGDAGLLKVFEGWKLGVSASNFGARLKFGSRSFDAPLVLRGGVAVPFLENYLVSAEGIKAGSSGTAAALGAEARVRTGPKEYFVMRAGYKTGRSRNAGPGVTAGIGVVNRELRVDYAFVPYGDLGDAHRVTVSYRFGAQRPEELRKGYGGLPPPRAKTRAPAPKRAEEKTSGDRKKEKKDPSGVYFMW